jgi:hypothetical protein
LRTTASPIVPPARIDRIRPPDKRVAAIVAARSQRPANCLSLSEEHQMPLLNLVIVLILVGVALHLINRYIPMASSIKTILNIVVVVVVCVWLLQATGMWSSVTNFRLNR